MTPLLVRDVMTIGVPVCRDTETCGAVSVRLAHQPGLAEAPAIVVLDEDGMACGWTTSAALRASPVDVPIGTLMDEDIPTVPPDIPAAVAAQMMRDRGVKHLFLMHDWPGEPRPSAVVSLEVVEKRLAAEAAR